MNENIDPTKVEHWREKLKAARADAAWVSRNRERDSVRERIRPEIRNLFDSFADGSVDLRQVASTFDSLTRMKWSVFGLAGQSGAMFLNTLAKHLGTEPSLVGQLRDVLRVPESEEQGRERLGRFELYLRGLIDSGVIARRQVQPSRAPFFVSAVWHLCDPESWPVFYGSARAALEADGLYDDQTDEYFVFRSAYLALDRALGTRRWELEHLCSRTEDRPKTDTAAAPRRSSPHVWLWAPGPNRQPDAVSDARRDQGRVAQAAGGGDRRLRTAFRTGLVATSLIAIVLDAQSRSHEPGGARPAVSRPAGVDCTTILTTRCPMTTGG